MIQELPSTFQLHLPDRRVGAVRIYEKIEMATPPTLGNADTLDIKKWFISADDTRFYMVGEVRNMGESTPQEMFFRGVLRNKGEVIQIFGGKNQMPLVLPPGERVKFKFEVPVPDAYDSFDVTIVSFDSRC